MTKISSSTTDTEAQATDAAAATDTLPTDRAKRPRREFLEFYATCPEGFEDALEQELVRMGLRKTRPLKGRVSFTGTVRDAYTACLWSRLASRVFVVLARVDAFDSNMLYDGAHALAWETILAPGASIAVAARGTNQEIRNTHYAALCIKDAICDRMLDTTGMRPNVDTDYPDARIQLGIRNDRATLSLDLSGDPLFKRLPREATHGDTGAHVMRPDYAALALELGGWTSICASARAAEEAPSMSGAPLLVDTSCAGGGIVLEAAQIMLDRAPGLSRRTWGFEGWAKHEPETWHELVAVAQDREATGAALPARIVATDVEGSATATARRILKAAGIAKNVIFAQPDATKLQQKIGWREDTDEARAATLIAADITEVPVSKFNRAIDLIEDARTIEHLAQAPTVAITREAMLKHALGAPATTVRIKPNNEDAELLLFPATSSTGMMSEQAEGQDNAASGMHSIELGDGPVSVHLEESAQFAARLKKVFKQRRKWAERAGVSCYRIYDADLPDYSAAIDIYHGIDSTPGTWVVIAEYAAPKTIDPALAQARFLDILAIAPRVLGVEPDHVHAKARTRSRGGSQYAASKSQEKTPISERRLPMVSEGGLTFAVNFDDYLDTGLFLDHRVTRSLLREEAAHAERFLNLFAYTGTATCYAADAGVRETTTVDLSNTYLDWARRNMRLNGFTGSQHHFVRADVLRWISEERRTNHRWDLIFCDPPTFSNSSKMGNRTWDVQRDHVDLLAGVSRLLTRDGIAVFSCNLRTFRPDTRALARAGVVLEDVTALTIPEDFCRNQRIHKCYVVRRHSVEDAMRLAGMDEAEIAERSRELSASAKEHPDRIVAARNGEYKGVRRDRGQRQGEGGPRRGGRGGYGGRDGYDKQGGRGGRSGYRGSRDRDGRNDRHHRDDGHRNGNRRRF